ncbi:MAG: efflux RND transporter periplasmic adaptor subunit [Deltaproteobacteria bacterium]|nr:MAG: efflux RND transporter periplasmic adaptor subunit [Deltaproteobacteria bacterium]
MKKLSIILIVIAVAGIIGWQVYQKASVPSKSSDRRDKAIPVELTPIKKITIRDIGRFTGTLYPRSQFVVAPKIAGRLEKLWFNIGDSVAPGQLIAVIDDAEYLQQVDQARAELEVSKALIEEKQSDLEVQKREFDRITALRRKKIVSASELEIAEAQYRSKLAQYKVAQSQIVQKEAFFKAAEVRLSYTRTRVPKYQNHGQWVVGERYVDEGAMLAANTPIVSILEIGTLIAVIHVIERDYPKIHPQLEAVVSTDAFPERTFYGKVVRISPLLMEKSREAKVEIEIPNDQRLLKPGMFVRVLIGFEAHENATVVHITALVKRNGRRGVFVVDRQEKKARFVPVDLGIVNGTLGEILNPQLSVAVVTLGHHLLEDGVKILLSNELPGNDRPRRFDEKDVKTNPKPITGERS